MKVGDAAILHRCGNPECYCSDWKYAKYLAEVILKYTNSDKTVPLVLQTSGMRGCWPISHVRPATIEEKAYMRLCSTGVSK